MFDLFKKKERFDEVLAIVEGQKIKSGEFIGKVNFKEIREAGKGTEVYVIFPDINDSNKVVIDNEKQLLHGETVTKITV